MDIYAPIAHRLGISKIKVELDDLSMKYLMPDTYNDLVKQVDINRPGQRSIYKEYNWRSRYAYKQCRHRSRDRWKRAFLLNLSKDG